MRDLTAIGLTLMNRMVSIASANPGGAVVCTFKLVSGTAYDPDSGRETDTFTTETVNAFFDRADDADTKVAAQDKETARLVLACDALSRLPRTKDEVTFNGRKWKVSDAKPDDMGVQLYVGIIVS